MNKYEGLKEDIKEFLEMLESDASLIRTRETKDYIKNLINDLKEILIKY